LTAPTHSTLHLHRHRDSNRKSLVIATPSISINYQTRMGTVVIPHLKSGWHVDQAIVTEDERLVVIRFGRDQNEDCMVQDEVLYQVAERVKNFAVIYVCDLDEVPDFNTMYGKFFKSLFISAPLFFIVFR
jgi:Mitosis protein DIM1